MGFSLWSPLYRSDGSPGHVKISAVAILCETEETKAGSRAAQYCSVSECEELRCSHCAVLPSHSSPCRASSCARQAHAVHGISRTSAFVVSEKSDVSEPKVDIKNPAFLLLKKEHRQNTRDY